MNYKKASAGRHNVNVRHFDVAKRSACVSTHKKIHFVLSSVNQSLSLTEFLSAISIVFATQLIILISSYILLCFLELKQYNN